MNLCYTRAHIHSEWSVPQIESNCRNEVLNQTDGPGGAVA